MLLREDGDDVICIGQAAHAWLAGQIARAWAEPFEPRDEICLATDQHDLGMAAWDAAPELNPATGRPYSFIEMPIETHLGLWSVAPQLILGQSRYAALLASLHGTALYGMRDLGRMSEADADRVRGYMAAQRVLQAELSAGLDPAQVSHNQGLLWIWDFLSLALCLCWEGRSVSGITVRDGTIDPWPFRERTVSFAVEGRRLEGTFSDEDAMRGALRRAPFVELRFELDAR